MKSEENTKLTKLPRVETKARICEGRLLHGWYENKDSSVRLLSEVQKQIIHK